MTLESRGICPLNFRCLAPQALERIRDLDQKWEGAHNEEEQGFLLPAQEVVPWLLDGEPKMLVGLREEGLGPTSRGHLLRAAKPQLCLC